MAKITYKITATQMYGDKELDTITLRNGDGTICEELYNTISNNFWESVKACHGCEFEECEVWDMPCCKCKRISKDFYRQRKM